MSTRTLGMAGLVVIWLGATGCGETPAEEVPEGQTAALTGFLGISGAKDATAFRDSVDALLVGFLPLGFSDHVVWRPSTGEWLIRDRMTGVTKTVIQGSGPRPGCWFIISWCTLPSDVPLTGDFDGDALSDIVTWRPVDGTWTIALSSGGVSLRNMGNENHVPIIGDFDGDSKLRPGGVGPHDRVLDHHPLVQRCAHRAAVGRTGGHARARRL